MKPTFRFTNQGRLARHDPRCENRRPIPAIQHFYRPGPDTPVDRASARAFSFDRARHAFRRMAGEMLTKHERDEPVELFSYLFVTAVALWPLIDLLIVLAQTARG